MREFILSLIPKGELREIGREQLSKPFDLQCILLSIGDIFGVAFYSTINLDGALNWLGHAITAVVIGSALYIIQQTACVWLIRKINKWIGGDKSENKA